jgi:hypothetical protein
MADDNAQTTPLGDPSGELFRSGDDWVICDDCMGARFTRFKAAILCGWKSKGLASNADRVRAQMVWPRPTGIG